MPVIYGLAERGRGAAREPPRCAYSTLSLCYSAIASSISIFRAFIGSSDARKADPSLLRPAPRQTGMSWGPRIRSGGQQDDGFYRGKVERRFFRVRAFGARESLGG